jgi:hypothetical protein
VHESSRHAEGPEILPGEEEPRNRGPDPQAELETHGGWGEPGSLETGHTRRDYTAETGNSTNGPVGDGIPSRAEVGAHATTGEAGGSRENFEG